MRIALFAAVLAFPASAGLASAPLQKSHRATEYLRDATMTYQLFEATVPHVDLAACPPEFDAEVVFCRMTLANNMAHIFAFALEGEQKLMVVKDYELTAEFIRF
jgi:hypothetical protein